MLVILFAPIIFFGNILSSNTDLNFLNYFRLFIIYIPTVLFILLY